MGILITFSVSILLIYVLQDFKNQLIQGKLYSKILMGALFVLLVALAFVVTESVIFDYGIMGIMLPVLFSVPSIITRSNEQGKSGFARVVDSNLTRVLIASAVLVLYAVKEGQAVYYYALLSSPFILLYSGRRGKLRLKWFFYIFYPTHLVAIYLIFYLLKLMA